MTNQTPAPEPAQKRRTPAWQIVAAVAGGALFVGVGAYQIATGQIDFSEPSSASTTPVETAESEKVPAEAGPTDPAEVTAEDLELAYELASTATASRTVIADELVEATGYSDEYADRVVEALDVNFADKAVVYTNERMSTSDDNEAMLRARLDVNGFTDEEIGVAMRGVVCVEDAGCTRY